MPKYLPTPTHSFTIPSLYDGIQLSCRIYLPQESSRAGSQWWQGAIVAHPYASLGGSYDDPVVSFIGAELLEAGYVVGTFNFRGAGDSEGSTSWTAKPELADYVSFYGFMMLYLQSLRRKVALRPGNEGLGHGVQLILGGYSYGSMVASHLPSSKAVADIFGDSTQGPAGEISHIARTICASSGDGISSSTTTDTDTTTVLELSSTAISYLLVSPILPPINLFLTLFLDLSLETYTKPSGQRQQIPCPKPREQLCAHRTLAIYGDEDTFTSVGKLRKWSGELTRAPESRFLCAEIEGAGHFWREEDAEPQARHSLRLWLRQQP
ncbi:Alpha/Beta hydrolase protein [Aspergillus californicus]